MAPGLACMNVMSEVVRPPFTVPSALSTSTGYRHGAFTLNGQGEVPLIVLTCVVSSAIRRLAFCQYPPPVAGHPVIHGTHSIPGWEGPEMLWMLVVIWGLLVLNVLISACPICRVLTVAQLMLPAELVPSTCMFAAIGGAVGTSEMYTLFLLRVVSSFRPRLSGAVPGLPLPTIVIGPRMFSPLVVGDPQVPPVSRYTSALLCNRPAITVFNWGRISRSPR